MHCIVNRLLGVEVVVEVDSVVGKEEVSGGSVVVEGVGIGFLVVVGLLVGIPVGLVEGSDGMVVGSVVGSVVTSVVSVMSASVDVSVIIVTVVGGSVTALQNST